MTEMLELPHKNFKEDRLKNKQLQTYLKTLETS